MNDKRTAEDITMCGIKLFYRAMPYKPVCLLTGVRKGVNLDGNGGREDLGGETII